MKEKLYERLIETFTRWAGGASRLLVGEKMVDNKVYEIEQVAKAIADTQHLPVSASYEGGKLSISSKNQASEESELAYRVLKRIAHQEAKRQIAAESVTVQASRLLREGDAPVEKPSATWIETFFDHASSVGEEEVRSLWARVLAGEIAKPGLIGLRTIEVLSTIDQTTARAFESLFPFIVTPYHRPFEPVLVDEHISQTKLWGCLMRCVDAGLVRSLVEGHYFTAIEEPATTRFKVMDSFVEIERAAPSGKYFRNARSLTVAGAELFGLLTREDLQPPMNNSEERWAFISKMRADGDYLERVAEYFSYGQVSICYGASWWEKGKLRGLIDVVPDSGTT